jgi:pyruvate/2-oxoglutarate dehydrogenase complex dihydrolipoamide dehydrogenase (E3) component/anti-anti-sigma regulatory factor
MGNYDYDLIVIGGGIAGFAASVTANGLGKKVAVVESRRLGGNCTSFTCIPSKALIGAAHVSRQVARLEEMGLRIDGDATLNTDNVMARVRSVVQRAYEKDSPETFEAIGIRVLSGSAEFLDRHRIAVDGHPLSARSFIIAAGTRPLVPPIDGLDQIDYLTNESVFDLDELPGSLMILGAGVDGLEYASAFGRLGVEVTVVEMAPRLLPMIDRELSDGLLSSLRAEGIRILSGTKAVGFSMRNGRKVLAVESAEAGAGEVEADAVLVTIGRKPNLDGLSLERAGVKYGPRGVLADGRLRTSARNIYACGDIVGPYQLASTAEYQGIVAATNVVLPVKRKADYENAVFVIFTEPAIGYTGLTEEQAREKYGDRLAVLRFDYRGMRRAIVDGAELGVAKLLCRPDGRLVGAHILGEAAPEVIHELQAVRALGKPLHALYSATHAYPTYAQAIVGRASQLAYLEKMERSRPVRVALGLLPGYENRLRLARSRLSEKVQAPAGGHVRTVDIRVKAGQAAEKEVRVEAVRVSDQACVVHLGAEVTDQDEAPVVMACSQTGPEDVRRIILDFTAVRRLNGLGASMLVKLAAASKVRHQKLTAYGLSDHYRDVFRVTGLDRAIEVHDSRAQALMSAGSSPDEVLLAEAPEPAPAKDADDEASWAEPVARLRVADMPAMAISLNVTGRRPVGPVEGFGPLWQKVYTQHLNGAKVTPAEAVKALKDNFPAFQPPQNRFYPSSAGIEPGAIVLINASTPGGPVYTGVMVLYADDESFTFITPQGHPESGWVSFSAFEEEGKTVVQILGLARANDPVYEAAFRLMGSRVQEGIWRHVLSSLAGHLGVVPDVRVQKERVERSMRWSAVGNVRHNAQIRSLLYAPIVPLRRRRAKAGA